MKTVIMAVLPDCDICCVEFPSSPPNKAAYDGQLGGGMWGYMCKAHKGSGKPITKLVTQ